MSPSIIILVYAKGKYLLHTRNHFLAEEHRQPNAAAICLEDSPACSIPKAKFRTMILINFNVKIIFYMFKQCSNTFGLVKYIYDGSIQKEKRCISIAVECIILIVQHEPRFECLGDRLEHSTYVTVYACPYCYDISP